MVKNKIIGTILVTLSILVMMGVTVFMLLSADTNIMVFLLETEWAWLWVALPKVMIAVLAMGAVGGELLIWRTIQRYIVR